MYERHDRAELPEHVADLGRDADRARPTGGAASGPSTNAPTSSPARPDEARARRPSAASRPGSPSARSCRMVVGRRSRTTGSRDAECALVGVDCRGRSRSVTVTSRVAPSGCRTAEHRRSCRRCPGADRGPSVADESWKSLPPSTATIASPGLRARPPPPANPAATSPILTPIMRDASQAMPVKITNASRTFMTTPGDEDDQLLEPGAATRTSADRRRRRRPRPRA